jgi:hypothetical protein
MKTESFRGKIMKGLCPKCSELEGAKHVILGCGETTHLRMNLKGKKYLNYHKGLIIKNIINCNNSFFVKILEITCSK